MASNFLLLTEEAIAEGLDLTSGDKEQFLKLNRHQCKYVARKMSESREVLQVLEPAVGYVVQFEAALKELYRVVTNALSLIKDCRFEPALKKDDRSEPSLSKDDHHESWLRAAITQRSYERSEDFAQICYDLQWCTSIVSICCLQSAGTLQDPILVREDCDGRLGAVDLFKLQRAANQDRDDLRSNLEPLKQGHVCDGSCELSQTDSSLAAHLLERLNSKPTPTTTEILTSSLWKVDAQDLPDGELLGRGSFGIVMETEWLGQKHAKKVFFGTQEGSFKTESEVLAGLSHPHLLRIVGSSVDRRKKKCALIMELMQGDLFEFLEAITVPLSILTALDLMLQVARGLKYLHSRRIVHRDLKSANILVASLTGAPELEPCLNAKLADFGLSKTKNSSTAYSRQTLNIGTRKWMAPEVFEIPQDKIDNGSMEPPDPRAHPFKADVYSFAIVCSEILTQEEPFPGVPLSDLLKHIRAGRRPDLPDGCPRRLASLIKRCWELEPRSRPDFPEICRELRYIKGLLLTAFDATGDERKDREVGILPFPTSPTEWCETHGLEVPKKPGSKREHVKVPEYSAGERATVDHLLQKLTSSQPDMQRAAAGELRLLAKHVENQICIADAGAIPLLVGLLSTRDLKTQEHSVTALLNLSINDDNKGAIVNAGAINPIVEVLRTGSKEARENAAATLFSLSVVDENKISIGNSGAIPALVDLLTTGTSRGKKDAATALFHLAIYQGNKARAVRAGVVAPLMELLEDASAGMVDEALAILAILATHQEGRVAIGQASAIPVLVALIHSGSSRNKENAAAVLLALTITDPAHIEKARELGAYGALTDLASHGTARAKRKAIQLLEHMRKQEGQSIPLSNLDVSL